MQPLYRAKRQAVAVIEQASQQFSCSVLIHVALLYLWYQLVDYSAMHTYADTDHLHCLTVTITFICMQVWRLKQ
jgi:hypothetical protein